MTLSLGECARLACVWEVTAPKAGNVYPGRDIGDLLHVDFLAGAEAISPIFDKADKQAVGQTVLEAIQATRAVVTSNINLGIVLLLAPLAAVPRSQSLRVGIGSVLDALTVADSRQVFQAIRLAKPRGLGQVSNQDVADEPTLPLRQIMAVAADRDLIARQYVNDFQDVFEIGLPAFREGLNRFKDLNQTIVFTQLKLLAQYPDSDILRKRGLEEAEQASALAQGVLAAGWPETSAGQEAFDAFDAWLTALGVARNPGTSADLVTATLFVALREKVICV